MSGSRLLTTIVVCSALVLAPCIPAPWGQALAAQTDDQLLNTIPADVLFCVRINNLDYTTNQLDQFITGVSPVPLIVSMTTRTQLAQLFGSPEITGVNMAGNFAVFATADPASAAPQFYALIPITDYDQFIQANPNVSPPDTSGVSTITVENQPRALAMKLGDCALLSQPQAGLPAAARMLSSQSAALASALDNDQTSKAATERIWLYCNTQKASQTFAAARNQYLQMFNQLTPTTQGGAPEANLPPMQPTETPQQQIERLKQKQAEAQTRIENLEKRKVSLAEALPEEEILINEIDNAIQILKDQQNDIDRQIRDIESGKAIRARTRSGSTLTSAQPGSVILELLNQTKSFTLHTSPEPDALNLTAMLTAIPGTEVAEMFTSADQTSENNLLGYLDNGAMMNFSVDMKKPFFRKINEKAIDWMSAISGEALSAESAAELRTLVADMASAFGGYAVCSVSIDPNITPPFEVTYAAQINDPEKFNAVMQRTAEIWDTSGINNFYQQLGMNTSFTFSRNVDTYKDISIDSAEFAFEALDATSPEAQIINAMYAGGFDYRWAITDGLWLCSIGPNADQTLHNLIDTALAGGPTEVPSEVTDALALVGDAQDADIFFTYNQVQAMNLGMRMLPMTMPAAANMPKLTPVSVPTKSSFVFAGTAQNGSFTLDAAVPKQHLVEIMTAVQAMMMQNMQQMQMMQQPPGQTPMPMPNETPLPAMPTPPSPNEPNN